MCEKLIISKSDFIEENDFTSKMLVRYLLKTSVDITGALIGKEYFTIAETVFQQQHGSSILPKFSPFTDEISVEKMQINESELVVSPWSAERSKF